MSHNLTADQALSLAYAQANLHGSIRAAYILDDHFGSIVAASKEPLLTRIKLAWWKEQGLEQPVPGTRAGDATLLLRKCLVEMVTLIEAWDLALDDANAAQARGAALFSLVAATANCALTPAALEAAKGWGIADQAMQRHCSRSLAQAALHFTGVGLKDLRGPLKPLGVLAALAERDCERGLDRVYAPGSPRRMLIALRFALFNF